MKGMQALRPLLRAQNMIRRPQYGMQQVQNMFEENLKHEVQRRHDSKDLIETYDRLYKPTYSIEFNREGEVLLQQINTPPNKSFSCDPFVHSTIYLKYPYILYESMIPASIYMFLMNPLDIAWYWGNVFAFLPFFLWTPRMWYFKELSQKIQRMYLLKGGKVVRVETSTLSGDRNLSYVEIYNFHPLDKNFADFDNRDEADFLEEEGTLKHELACQLDNYQDLGCNVQDHVIYFMKEGIVHHPELFEAVCKGYHVDTTEYTINTAHNRRAREGNHNH